MWGQCLLLNASPEIFGVAHKYLILLEQISKPHKKTKTLEALGLDTAFGKFKISYKKKQQHYFRSNIADTNYTVKQASKQKDLLFIAWK